MSGALREPLTILEDEMRAIEYIACKRKNNRSVKFKGYTIKNKEGITQISKKGKRVYTLVDFTNVK